MSAGAILRWFGAESNEGVWGRTKDAAEGGRAHVGMIGL